MAFIRRNWTPDAAEQWSREDWIAAAFSALAYLLIIVGGTLALLNLLEGYLLLLAGIIAAAAMYWVIDPKLRAVSDEYERKQKEFLEHVERITRWEKEA